MVRILQLTLTIALTAVAVGHAQDWTIDAASDAAFPESGRSSRRPYVSQHMETQTVTTYREQYGTSLQDQVRLTYEPRTTYAWQRRQRGWWNPFARPHSTYELTPHTRWVPLWEQTRMPISTRRLIPQTRVVQRPVTILGFKDEGDSRVTRAELAQDEQLAQAAPDETGWHAGRSKQTPVGGIARLEDDPPRADTRLDAEGWRR